MRRIIGTPVPSTDVLIVDEAGEPVPLGTLGELLIKGPQVFAGYWNCEDETRRSFTQDGWFRTGDIVTMDAQGLMYIVDRKKDMILLSGFNVYPNEIEGVVAMHPDVLECACVGVPDERSAEVPHLFVVRRVPGLRTEELETRCRKLLTAYKVPHHITFLESQLKPTVGKILRKELRPVSDAAWVSPVVAWLASEASARVTGRVIEAGGGVLAVAEDWHRGQTAPPVRDAEQVGLIIERLASESRPKVALNGKDFATPWEP